MKNNKLAYYIFIEELNEKIIKNIIKLKKKAKNKHYYTRGKFFYYC